MRPNADDLQCWGKSLYDQLGNSSYWAGGAVQLHRLKAGKWQLHRNFGAEAAKEIVRIDPPDHAIQRLYVNPKNRHLYICELRGAAKSFEKLVEIDPESGTVKEVPVPFTAEDICFDPQGMIYLRTDQEVVRYDPRTWREIPWDYGEERRRVSFSGDPSADAISALPIPGVRPMWFHEYGLWVNAKGNLAVSCTNARVDPKERVPGEIQLSFQTANVTPYSPRLYPGRARHQEIHVFNKHGQKLYDDAIPGMAIYDGLVIDANDDLYVMSQTTRFFGTKPYFNRDTGTLVKFAPQKGKVLATTTNQTRRYAPFTPVPLPEDSYPKRPPDVVGGGLDKAWMDGAQWFYGGLGFAARASGGCNCWHARFTQDYFARSFAPETDHYSIAVLDNAGNLILRIGRYGNADSLGAKSLVPLGGDEVGLFYPAYLAADTDRRLFVADIGNYRISSIALGYHKDAKVTLKEAAGAKE